MSNETRPLTRAQINHLIRLNEAVLQAQAALEDFIVYLREEHVVPAADGWKLENIQTGFERTTDETIQVTE